MGICKVEGQLRPGPGSVCTWDPAPVSLPAAGCCRESPSSILQLSLCLCFPRQLMENQIGVVERGAFDDMKELERL